MEIRFFIHMVNITAEIADSTNMAQITPVFCIAVVISRDSVDQDGPCTRKGREPRFTP